jgi:hypothetical protein
VKTTIKSNAADIARKMTSRAGAVARELRNENVAIAKDLTAASLALLQRDVYAVPVKVSRTGRPLWTRTGQLRAEDRWVAIGMSVVHRNRAPHFRHRERYGKAGGRPASPPQRAAHWVRDAVLKNGSKIRARRRAALARSWGRAR